MASFLFRSHPVRHQPETGLLSCLDLWKSADRPPRRRPGDWLGHPLVRAQMPTLLAQLYPTLPPKERTQRALHRTRGRGGVWGDPHIAVAYAQFLGDDVRDHLAEVLVRRGIPLNPDLVPLPSSPKLPLDLNGDSEVVLRQMAAIQGLALAPNPGAAFEALTTAIYEPLFGDLRRFRQARGLGPHDSLRTALTPAERALVEAAERLATEDLLAAQVSGLAILDVVRQRARRIATMR